MAHYPGSKNVNSELVIFVLFLINILVYCCENKIVETIPRLNVVTLLITRRPVSGIFSTKASEAAAIPPLSPTGMYSYKSKSWDGPGFGLALIGIWRFRAGVPYWLHHAVGSLIRWNFFWNCFWNEQGLLFHAGASFWLSHLHAICMKAR